MSQFYQNDLVIILILLWTLPWKIYALWTAVKKNHKAWFVVIVVFNTFAILEIIYIFFIAKKKWSEVKHAFIKAILPKKSPKEQEEK